MECILCNKPYVGKAETAFNIRSTQHQLVDFCKNSHTKFIVIDKLVNTSSSKDIYASVQYYKKSSGSRH